jgi:hypothetical protein
MDLRDYTLFVSCFGKKPPCAEAEQVDLDDNGVIDGIDYNIMALGFKNLVSLGFPAPQLPTPKPTQVSRLSELKITPKAKPTVIPSVAPVVKKPAAANPLGGILGFFGFVMVLVVGFVVFSRTKFGKAFLAKHPLPIKLPPMPGKTNEVPAAKKIDSQPDPAAPPPADGQPPADDSVASIAESTEIPIADLAKSTEIPVAAVAESTEIPIAEFQAAKTAPVADASAIDKTYYVKNKSKDEKGTWVVLTDDAGPIDGLLPTGEIEDGFERIKGKLTEEKGKKYILISEILPSE